MILYLTHGNGEESIPLKLPASSSQVEEINIRLDDICSGEGNFRISDAKSSVKGLWQFISRCRRRYRSTLKWICSNMPAQYVIAIFSSSC